MRLRVFGDKSRDTIRIEYPVQGVDELAQALVGEAIDHRFDLAPTFNHARVPERAELLRQGWLAADLFHFATP
jgi:hypothetical protein